ncbi:MAG: cysteine hydrolase, partial [Actinobacteria bacterium]|nr:cysteine hydrolase [Actinomycetota bacterium]
CTTSICVESTIRDAMMRDYRCVLLEDCTAEPIGQGLPRTNHEASLLVIETLFGWVSDSAALIEALDLETSTGALRFNKNEDDWTCQRKLPGDDTNYNFVDNQAVSLGR